MAGSNQICLTEILLVSSSMKTQPKKRSERQENRNNYTLATTGKAEMSLSYNIRTGSTVTLAVGTVKSPDYSICRFEAC